MRSRRTRLILLLAPLALLLVLAGWLWLEWRGRQAAERAVRRASEGVASAAESGWERTRRHLTERAQAAAREGVAVAAARGVIRTAWRPWAEDPESVMRERFLRLVEAGESTAAEGLRHLWQPDENDAVTAAATVQLDIRLGRLQAARESAWSAAERFPNQRSAFIGLWYDGFTADPEFWQPSAIDIEPGAELTRIRTFDVATSVLLRFYAGNHITGLLKPMQTNPFTNYRGEIAAYRLCALIHCTFSIPHNAEVRIEEEVLRELMGFDDVDSVRQIRRNESELIWFQDETGRRWLYGTLKEWVPGFSNFPIEQVDGWRQLVDGSLTSGQLRRLGVSQALGDLADADPERWAAFTARLEGTSTFELAHQLSDLHVFDLLINNWDRYSSAYPASNCQWNHGRFVSIDNGASFQTPDEWVGHEVELRIRRIRTFSRRTIAAIRWMDTERLFGIMFPPNPFIQGERERWDYFLRRRQFLLDYVDELIQREGEENVLIFP